MTAPKKDGPDVNTFAGRRAEREAREAEGDFGPTPNRKVGFRAGIDAENPLLVVTNVSS